MILLSAEGGHREKKHEQKRALEERDTTLFADGNHCIDAQAAPGE